MDLLSVWEKAQQDIRSRVGQTSYDTWFAALQVSEGEDESLVIETPDDFFKNWIIEHYKDSIEEICGLYAQKKIDIQYSVNADVITKTPHTQLPQINEECVENEKVPKDPINNRFTFDNFVIGPSNRFACAASLAVAESPAKAYNPLFIYGQVGLGKTHLIQSVTHKIRQIHPDLKQCYITSEKFTNELIDSIRHRSTTEFRKKYRQIDVLLIDDIQFIAGKESTQEEFFHTFNNLHDNHKQIIITSDKPPKDIANLEERLRSRFSWGLIADIQPPDFETRVAILRKKMEGETVNVPEEVIHFIADQIKTNIRELEGALIRVAAVAMLEEKPLGLSMAKSVLKDMVKETSQSISFDVVQKTVGEYFGISVSEIKGKKRNQQIVQARQIAMYLARELSRMSLPEIGRAFGGKDHTTVLHSCKKIEKDMKLKKDIRQVVQKLITIIQQR